MNDQTQPVLVIQGPTASGKTLLAHYLAEHFPIEIISADSRQVYRGMDIGTAKPNRSELRQYNYYGIDICDPDDYISAGSIAQQAWQWIAAVRSNGHIPLIVGGSGLYVQAITKGLFEQQGDIPQQIRQHLFERINQEGCQSLYQELQFVDPIAAARIHDLNPRRILRALEFYYTFGIPLTMAQRLYRSSSPQMDIVRITLLPERSILYKRIEERSTLMWKSGLLDETLHLLQSGYDSALPSLQTIGYAEAIAVMNSTMHLQDAIARSAQRTRNYAKRQYTWLRHSVDLGLVVTDLIAELDKILQFVEHTLEHLHEYPRHK